MSSWSQSNAHPGLVVAARAEACKKIRLVASSPIAIGPESLGSPVFSLPSVPTITATFPARSDKSKGTFPSVAVALSMPARLTPKPGSTGGML